MNSAFVFKPLIDADVHLSVQTISPGVYRRTHDRGERRVNEQLAANNHEDSLSPWVSRRGMLNEIQLSAFHLFFTLKYSYIMER